MKRIGVVLLVVVCLAVSSGCYRTVYRGEDLPFGAAMNRLNPATETIVYHFEEDKWNHYFLFALVPTSEPDLKDLIGRHVPPGCEVRDLTIRHQVTFLNGLVSFLVGWIYSPMTTTVTGDVVRLQAPGSSSPAAPAR